MVKMDQDDVIVELRLNGGGSQLAKVQGALLLGIEAIGSDEEKSGNPENQEAVWLLCGLLREFMLNESQVNIGLGGKPYSQMRKTQVFS